MEENFTKEEIIKGIEKYKKLQSQNKLNPNRASVTTSLKYQDKEYPVKYIVDLAYLIKTNSDKIDDKIYPRYIAIRILKSLGFEVIGKNESENDRNEKNMKHPLNQILYGPPGTGKTYNTINRALEIILEQEEDKEIKEILKEKKHTKKEREILTNKFKDLRKSKQIEFVTFHQSYGYEEFVEGIKADVKSSEIKYKLEKGIFHELSKQAESNYDDSKKSKVQLEKELTLKEKIETFLSEAFENETEFHKIQKKKTFKIVDIIEDTITIEADGVQYPVLLKKEELTKVLESEQRFNSVAQLSKEGLGYKDNRQSDSYYFSLYKAFNETSFKNIDVSEETNILLKNHILIIDEINRGNISKIFGELITLIEPSKRIGADEELKLTLPNSKDSFGVPSNFYIIGTMNTADRSIAQIDTALRRRFEFVEMMPQADLLNGIEIEGINIQKVLEAINERIEYIYDREHTIGHSYFMPLIKTLTKDKLDEIFKVNIIPLLAEYFYGDWADIKTVLNDKKNYFITKKETSTYVIDEKRKNNEVYIINDSFSKDGYTNIYQTSEKTDEK